MPERNHMFEPLLRVGRGAPSTEEKVNYLNHLRASSPDMAASIDRFYVETTCTQRAALESAQKDIQGLAELNEKLTAPAWYPATLVRLEEREEGPSALVHCGGSELMVTPAAEVDMAALQPGTEVLLSNERNAILAVAPPNPSRCGAVGVFQRRLADGRMVLDFHGEECVVYTSADFDASGLEPGDPVLWRPDDKFAYEALERDGRGDTQELEEYPDITRGDVGGQDETVREVLFATVSRAKHPEIFRRYGLDARQTIMLYGPPGTGKTLIARLAAAELRRELGGECLFSAVRPGQFDDPYYGVTIQKWQRYFERLGKIARSGKRVVAFIDEIESIARIRGTGMNNQYQDRILGTLLTSIQDAENVVIITATNRKDMLDPAVHERLAGIELYVGRPNLEGGRAIIDIHMRPGLAAMAGGGALRTEIVEAGLARLYAPNGDNEVCLVKLANNERRTVHACELVSGRLIAHMCRLACERACRRDIETGAAGIDPDDMAMAADTIIDRMRTQLTPVNAHAYLADLPQGVPVTAVEPIQPKVRVRDFLNVA